MNEYNENYHITPPWTANGEPQVPVIPPPEPPAPQAPFFPTGGMELLSGLLLLVTGWLLCNSIFFAGLYLGFAIFAGCALVLAVGYLLLQGRRLNFYSGALLGMSFILCAAFARSDDGFVKFILVLFLILSSNLGLCLLAGQNRRLPGGITSLLDVPRTVFALALGKLPESFQGVVQGLRNSGTAGRKGGAVLLGLLVAIPLLAIVIPLLISADAAFDALLQQLPDWDFGELIASIILGSFLAVFFYSRNTALRHAPKQMPAARSIRGVHPITVNTVLIMVALVYGVYLVSQLAYFSGGFSGILPEGYTMAEYARRGFFEMAWLCAINLGILALAVGLVRKEKIAPLATRLICLFIGIVTLFLVVSASAKMFLYIDAYGLTRLRVLTQVIIFFLGITTILVCLWLFLPRLPYMKAVLLTALVFCAVVAWADVDTVVAKYNVEAYQTGKLEHVDVAYLDGLGMGAIPYIAQLTEDADPATAARARRALQEGYLDTIEDFRDWNGATAAAEPWLTR